MRQEKVYERSSAYMKERKIQEIDNIATYYGVSKGTRDYKEVEDMYNTEANCVDWFDVIEKHKWKLKDSYRDVNVYRCKKCGALRRVEKF